MPQDRKNQFGRGRRRHKYGAQPKLNDGFRFDSKAEARRYGDLKLLQKAGEIVMFLRQVPFHLPGGVIYRADFLVFYADGSCVVEDVKGYQTAAFKAKKKVVEALYPVEIQLIKAGR